MPNRETEHNLTTSSERHRPIVNNPRLHIRACLLLGCAAVLASPPVAHAFGADEITAVASRTSDDYVRAKLPDGSFQPESYAFGEGGHWTGAVFDATLDKLSFMDVARTIAAPLEDQHYVPTRDAKTTKLLILVYWGRTSMAGQTRDSSSMQNLQKAAGTAAGAKSSNAASQAAAAAGITEPSGMACGHFEPMLSSAQVADQIDSDNALSGAMAATAAENRSRDQMDAQNAVMLGYDSLWSSTENLKGTPREFLRQDVASELEESRYFVVVMAYDFQKMWKEKKHKLLWETRVSVCQRRHNFDKDLITMTRYASQYFGQDSHGLIRKVLPDGRVEIGELKSLGAAPDR